MQTLLADNQNEWLSSNYIAGSLNINPVLVRKEISSLKSANIVESKEGNSGGLKLNKNPEDINISDIFLITKGKSNVFSLSKNAPNPHCQIGKKINENLMSLFEDIDESIKMQLKNITLEDFRKKF